MITEDEDRQESRRLELKVDAHIQAVRDAEEGLCRQCGGKEGECPHTRRETLAPAKVNVLGFRVERDAFMDRMARESEETRNVVRYTLAQMTHADTHIEAAVEALKTGNLGLARAFLLLGAGALKAASEQLPS